MEVADTCPEELGVSEAKRDALLHAYSELREEIRSHGVRKSRRFIATFTVTGVVVGYVFARDGDHRLLAVVPLLLAFQYLSHISSANYVANLAAVLCRVEKTLNCPGFEYEYHYGRFRVIPNPFVDSTLQARTRASPNDIVQKGMLFIAVLAYVLSSAAGVVSVWELGFTKVPGVSQSLGGPLVRGGLAAGVLVVYGVSFGYIWQSYREFRLRSTVERASIAVTPADDFAGVATEQWMANQRSQARLQQRERTDPESNSVAPGTE